MKTNWHTSWQNKFAKQYQEKIFFDKNGNKHIADVCTKNGVVIEFQHSAISAKELMQRVNFYQ